MSNPRKLLFGGLLLIARRCALEVSGAFLLVGINSPAQEQLADLGHASSFRIPDSLESLLELWINSNAQKYFSRHDANHTQRNRALTRENT